MSIGKAALGDLIEPAKTARAVNGDYPILSMTMHGGLVDQADKFKKRVASSDTSNYKVIKRGQLVVGFPIDEGVLSFQDLYEEAIVSPAYDVWNVLVENRIHKPYLERFLRSPLALTFYKGNLKSTTARRRTIPKETFLSLPVPLPPLVEQRRIAAILDQADALRRLRQHALDRLNTLGQSIFYEMFGDPARNQKGWSVGTIRDLLKEAKYGTSKKANTEEKGIPILRMGNVTYQGEIDLSDLKYVELNESEFPKYTTQEGDILFNRTNSKELVGKTAVFHSPEPMAIAGYLVRARVNEKADPFYISAYMNSQHGKATLRNMCKSIVGMANINAQEFQDIPIAIPPIKIQRAFRQKIERISDYKSSYCRALTAQENLFASIQQRAFRGEL